LEPSPYVEAGATGPDQLKWSENAASNIDSAMDAGCFIVY
jgi:hypothetical protein